jgi:hypothetical protein
MKAVLTLYILLLLQACAFGQDLPNPPANIQTLPQDSYVIAMDNTWQATTGINPSFHYFNLKAYGLIVYLLNNNIRVKRVIRSGKMKDDVDFSVSCRQIKPTAETVPVLRDFKAGPYVISGPDLLRVDINQLIDNFNNNYGGVSGIGSDTAKVRVYKTTADVAVDIRYDLTGFKPKATILTDGSTASGINYTQVHLTYLSLAGVPVSNYTTGANTDLDINCYSFASEPHNDYQNATVVNNIKNFVLAGGSFLAQCAAIKNYELLGHFQSTAGISVTNSTPAATYYPNADLNMSQFEGAFSIRQGGSVQNWQYSSSFANGAHAFATNTNGYVNGTSLVGASASKLVSSSSPGGMVFYLGNHQYTRTDDYNQINGIRMYLNALLTPPGVKNILSYSFNADCNVGAMKVASYNGPAVAYPVDFYLYQDNGAVTGIVDAADAFIGAATVPSPGVQKLIPLNGSDPNGDFVMKVVPNASCYKPEQVSPAPCRLSTLSAALKNFTASRSGGQVLLRWQTLTEQANDGFYVQRLVGTEWRDIAFVPSSAPGGNSSSKLQYQFVTDAQQGLTQYRIRMQGLDKSVQYSEIRLVQGEEVNGSFIVYPNPSSTGKATLYFAGAGIRSVAVYDISGRAIRFYTGISDSSFDLAKLTNGVYLVKVTDAAGTAQTQKLVVK